MNRIIVFVKQAVDVSQLKVDTSTRQLITSTAPKKISDFDKNALEEAIKIKEKTGDAEICTITVSAEDVKTVLREALAMGADKAFAVSDPLLKNVDTSGTAHVLAEATRKIGKFDLILCGETSLDSFSGLVGARTAELLGIPSVTSARRLTINEDSVAVERSLEESIETVKAKMPSLVSVTREINQPRIPSLMMIMKASKKEIVNWKLADLDIAEESIKPAIDILEVLAPKTERKKIMITGKTLQEIADKLADALVQEGVVR